MDTVKQRYLKGQIPKSEYRDLMVKKTLDVLQSYTVNHVSRLGKGTYGTVELLTTEGREVAAKIVLQRDVSEGEVKFWPELYHENILPLITTWDFPEADTSVFFMPKFPVILKHKIMEFQDDKKGISKTVKLLKDILNGVLYLHKKDLCHLDLKSDNVMISNEGNATITDFGFMAPTNMPTRDYGAPLLYRPPEGRHWGSKVCGKPFDMWTLGLMALEMLTGEALLKTATKKSQRITNWEEQVYPLIKDILQEKHFIKLLKQTFPASDGIKKAARNSLNLIRTCLNIDPSSRPTAEKALSHPLFGGSCLLFETPKPMDDIWNPKLSQMRLMLLLRKHKYNITQGTIDEKPTSEIKSNTRTEISRNQRMLIWLQKKKNAAQNFFSTLRPFNKLQNLTKM